LSALFARSDNTAAAAPFSAATLDGKAACKAALQRELGRPVDEAEVKALVASHFARLFEVDLADTAVDRLLGA
jgi:hypothetical protein